jgi:hypothetical protein
MLQGWDSPVDNSPSGRLELVKMTTNPALLNAAPFMLKENSNWRRRDIRVPTSRVNYQMDEGM